VNNAIVGKYGRQRKGMKLGESIKNDNATEIERTIE
jgi:hypothetical protein